MMKTCTHSYNLFLKPDELVINLDEGRSLLVRAGAKPGEPVYFRSCCLSHLFENHRARSARCFYNKFTLKGERLDTLNAVG